MKKNGSPYPPSNQTCQAWRAIACLLVFAAVGFSPRLLRAEQKVENHRYAEQTGDSCHEFSWSLKSTADIVEILVQEGMKHHITQCLPDGETIFWQVSAGDDRLQAIRKGNQWISDSGRLLAETEISEDTPWYQTLSYSLRPFLASPETSIVFFMLQPEKLKLIRMRAEKIGTETGTATDKSFRLERIKIGPDGPLGLLWNAEFLFRLHDGVMYRYEGVHGTPGTPKTVIWLLE